MSSVVTRTEHLRDIGRDGGYRVMYPALEIGKEYNAKLGRRTIDWERLCTVLMRETYPPFPDRYHAFWARVAAHPASEQLQNVLLATLPRIWDAHVGHGHLLRAAAMRELVLTPSTTTNHTSPRPVRLSAANFASLQFLTLNGVAERSLAHLFSLSLTADAGTREDFGRRLDTLIRQLRPVLLSVLCCVRLQFFLGCVEPTNIVTFYPYKDTESNVMVRIVDRLRDLGAGAAARDSGSNSTTSAAAAAAAARMSRSRRGGRDLFRVLLLRSERRTTPAETDPPVFDWARFMDGRFALFLDSFAPAPAVPAPGSAKLLPPVPAVPAPGSAKLLPPAPAVDTKTKTEAKMESEEKAAEEAKSDSGAESEAKSDSGAESDADESPDIFTPSTGGRRGGGPNGWPAHYPPFLCTADGSAQTEIDDNVRAFLALVFRQLEMDADRTILQSFYSLVFGENAAATTASRSWLFREVLARWRTQEYRNREVLAREFDGHAEAQRQLYLSYAQTRVDMYSTGLLLLRVLMAHRDFARGAEPAWVYLVTSTLATCILPPRGDVGGALFLDEFEQLVLRFFAGARSDAYSLAAVVAGNNNVDRFLADASISPSPRDRWTESETGVLWKACVRKMDSLLASQKLDTVPYEEVMNTAVLIEDKRYDVIPLELYGFFILPYVVSFVYVTYQERKIPEFISKWTQCNVPSNIYLLDPEVLREFASSRHVEVHCLKQRVANGPFFKTTNSFLPQVVDTYSVRVAVPSFFLFEDVHGNVYAKREIPENYSAWRLLSELRNLTNSEFHVPPIPEDMGEISVFEVPGNTEYKFPQYARNYETILQNAWEKYIEHKEHKEHPLIQLELEEKDLRALQSVDKVVSNIPDIQDAISKLYSSIQIPIFLYHVIVNGVKDGDELDYGLRALQYWIGFDGKPAEEEYIGLVLVYYGDKFRVGFAYPWDGKAVMKGGDMDNKVWENFIERLFRVMGPIFNISKEGSSGGFYWNTRLILYRLLQISTFESKEVQENITNDILRQARELATLNEQKKLTIEHLITFLFEIIKHAQIHESLENVRDNETKSFIIFQLINKLEKENIADIQLIKKFYDEVIKSYTDEIIPPDYYITLQERYAESVNVTPDAAAQPVVEQQPDAAARLEERQPVVEQQDAAARLEERQPVVEQQDAAAQQPGNVDGSEDKESNLGATLSTGDLDPTSATQQEHIRKFPVKVDRGLPPIHTNIIRFIKGEQRTITGQRPPPPKRIDSFERIHVSDTRTNASLQHRLRDNVEIQLGDNMYNNLMDFVEEHIKDLDGSSEWENHIRYILTSITDEQEKFRDDPALATKLTSNLLQYYFRYLHSKFNNGYDFDGFRSNWEKERNIDAFARNILEKVPINLISKTNLELIRLPYRVRNLQQDGHAPNDLHERLTFFLNTFYTSEDRLDNVYLLDVTGDGECFMHATFLSLHSPCFFKDIIRLSNLPDNDKTRLLNRMVSTNTIMNFCIDFFNHREYCEALLNCDIYNDIRVENLKERVEAILFKENAEKIRDEYKYYNEFVNLSQETLKQRFLCFIIFVRLYTLCLNTANVATLGEFVLTEAADVSQPGTDSTASTLRLFFPWLYMLVLEYNSGQIISPIPTYEELGRAETFSEAAKQIYEHALFWHSKLVFLRVFRAHYRVFLEGLPDVIKPPLLRAQ